jgi:hypothetical protein
VNRRAAQDKYAQLRIAEKALDRQIEKAEKGDDTNLLNDLYRRRSTLRGEMQQVIGRM